jgi:predicted phage baseplate assembly protein
VAQVLLTPVPSDDETGTSLASWTAAPDLLDGTAGNRFVVETDDRGTATLRLDPRFPQPDSGRFTAHYWAGNGAHGNLPAGSIDTVVLTEAAPEGLRDPRVGVDNPLPAVGGADPEPLASAKLRAPGAFRESQPRGLRAADYATIAARLPGVGRAAAAERFDGRRILIDVAITNAGHGEPSPHLVREVEAHLQRVRRIGHDLRVGPARYRGVRIAVTAAVDAAADEQDVRRRVTHLLDGRVTASRAPFSRTRLGFGTPVHASAVVAAVLDVPGVVDAALTEFTFADAPPGRPPRDRLVPEPLQILRLDDDPVHPKRGLVYVTVRRAS